MAVEFGVLILTREVGRGLRESDDAAGRKAHLEYNAWPCRVCFGEFRQRGAERRQRPVHARSVLGGRLHEDVEVPGGTGLGVVGDGEGAGRDEGPARSPFHPLGFCTKVRAG